MVRFLHNHGLLLIFGRPQWSLPPSPQAPPFTHFKSRYSVIGGSRQYVNAIVGGLADARLSCAVTSIRRHGQEVLVATERGVEAFDEVVMATHAPQSLQLLHEVPSPLPCPFVCIHASCSRLHPSATFLEACAIRRERRGDA